MAIPEVEIGPVTIDDAPQPIQGEGNSPVSIDVNGSAAVQLSDSDAATRAYKAALGASRYKQYNYGTFKQAIQDGKEDDVRVQTSDTVNQTNQKVRDELVKEIALNRGSALNQNDIDIINKNFDTLSVSNDPASIFEELYARQHTYEVKNTAQRLESPAYQQAQEVAPEAVQQMEHASNTLVAKREYLLKKVQDMHTLVQGQSWADYILDEAKQLIPGYNEIKKRGNVDGINSLDSGFLGSNLERQRKQLVSLPFPMFKEQLDQILDRMKEDNPSLAYSFAASMLGQSSQDLALNNAFSVVDVATLVPIAKLGVKAADALRTVKGAYQDTVRAAASEDISKPKMIEATGDIKTAAVKEATQNIIDETGGTANPVKRATDSLFSTLRVDGDNLKSNLGTATQNQVTKMEEQSNRFVDAFAKTVQESAYVIRNPALEDPEVAVKLAYEQVQQYYPGLKNNLLDVVGPFFDPTTKTYHYAMDLGDLHGLMFTEKETANNWAVKNGIQQFEIHQKGLGFYIRAYKPFDENDNFARNLMMETPGTRDPESLLDAWDLSKIRTPEETLSEVHRANRLIVAYTPATMQKVMAQEAKYIDDLAKGKVFDAVTGERSRNVFKYKLNPIAAKRRFEDWKRVVSEARYKVDPDSTDGIPGYFFKNNAELDEAYLGTVGRLPDFAERQAYFAFKRLAEGDRMLRNIEVYKYKSRLGVETHTANYKLRNGQSVETAPFDGARRADFPVSESDNILIIDEKGKPNNIALNDAVKNKKRADKWREDVKEGRATVIEIYDTESKPLTKVPGAENSRIRYVMSYDLKSKPIDFEQVPRRGGGHFDYDYDFYIKQAKITPAYDSNREVFKQWYEGDQTLMPISIRAMGHEVIGHLEKVRLALKAGDETAAKQAASKLPINWDEVRGWFKGQKDAKTGEINPPRFSLSEPFQLVKKGEMIVDKDNTLPNRYLHKDGKSTLFVDGTKHGSLARQSQVEYTGKRDADILNTINNEGTQATPVFNWERANMVDPVPSMNRALSKIINSQFMDDYKIFAYENWLRHAENYLKDSLNARTSPFWMFTHGEYKNNVDKAIVNRLENSRKRIQQLIGIPSKADAHLQRITQTLADGIYSKNNSKILLATNDKLASSSILADPIGALRSFVFHKVLGMMNPSQLLTQMQTYAAIWGISPAHAPMGTSGALMTVWARINRNPKWIDILDKKLSQLKIPGMHNWKSGEFKESMELLDRTGFDVVQGEYASLDRLTGVNLVKSRVGQILDAGTWPFKGGEKMVRYGAWHTAYKEFRTANPTKAISNKDLLGIQQRADLLYGNMSRASSSAIHEGIASIPTQFAAYQLRQLELFWGKRLTPKEKVTLFGTYSALYGLPIGVSGVAAYPFAESIRSKAQELGYVVGDSWWQSLAMEGGIATLLATLTGYGNPKRGTYFNVGERWGLQGFPQIRDALRSDHTFISVMTGALGTSVESALYATDPYWQMIKGFLGMNGFSSNPDDPKYYPPTSSDVLEILKEISSVNKGWQAWAAINTGNWLSKRNTLLEKGVSPYDAVFRFISGLQSQDASDANLMIQSNQQSAELQKYGLKRFTENYQRGIRLADTDGAASNNYFKKAFSWLAVTGWQIDKYDEALQVANRGVEPLVDRAKYDYWIRKSSPEDMQTKADAFVRDSKIQELKGQ